VPQIIAYDQVVAQMQRQGLISLYPASGAFGFAQEAGAIHRGWIGPGDASIRAEAMALVRRVAPPFDKNLAALCCQVWNNHLHGPMWLTPKSHWAYDLDFGNPSWLPVALESAGVSPDILRVHQDGSAVAFSPEDHPRAEALIATLLGNLQGSDFLLTWPNRPVVCTIHHHVQLWWSSTDSALIDAIDSLSGPAAV
jgi:hypothetical protein